MIDDTNRKRILDAIALLEQVLRESDTSVWSSSVLRALETARLTQPPKVLSSTEAGSADYGRERIEYQRKL